MGKRTVNIRQDWRITFNHLCSLLFLADGVGHLNITRFPFGMWVTCVPGGVVRRKGGHR